MTELQDLATLVRAATPLLVIETAEENRVIETFRHLIAQVLRPLYRWSITDGLRRLDMAETDAPDANAVEVAPDASATLLAIKRTPEAGIYLLLDFQPYLRYSMTLRLLREICQRQDCAAHSLVLITPKFELPEELNLQYWLWWSVGTIAKYEAAALERGQIVHLSACPRHVRLRLARRIADAWGFSPSPSLN